MWIGACTSSIGTWMQIVAQGWLIYRLSHSAFLLALDQFLGGIPIFLFSLIGGVIADRVERRKILLGSQYVQMATRRPADDPGRDRDGARLAHSLSVVYLGLRAGIRRTGLPGADSYPGRKRRHAECHRAEFDPVQRGGHGGPALAGQALAKLGEKWCFGLNAVSFLAPIISLSMITPVSAGENHRVDASPA